MEIDISVLESFAVSEVHGLRPCNPFVTCAAGTCADFSCMVSCIGTRS